MKTSEIHSNKGKAVPAHYAPKGCLAAVLVLLIGISWDVALCRAQPPGNDVPGAQVLTRGPVHEAFAQISESKAHRVPAVRAKHEQIASEQGRLKLNKGQNKKVTEQQTLQAKPAAPPSSQ